ncbi:phage tail protein [Vibrio vulnificus]
MSEVIDHETLLPDNRTTFERSFEEAIKGIVKSEDASNWIDDPLKTRAALLELMAAERGVNDWFFSDSEQAKRLITDMSYSIHQTSGTNEGINLALKAVDYSSQIAHWTKVDGGLPYTVYVLAWGDHHQTVTEEKAKRLIARINHVKSERDTVDLTLAFAMSQAMTINAAISHPTSVTPTDASAQLWALDLNAGVGACGGTHPGIAVSPKVCKAELPTTELALTVSYTAVMGGFVSAKYIYATARTA